jgi:hypothetical protein
MYDEPLRDTASPIVYVFEELQSAAGVIVPLTVITVNGSIIFTAM